MWAFQLYHRWFGRPGGHSQHQRLDFRAANSGRFAVCHPVINYMVVGSLEPELNISRAGLFFSARNGALVELKTQRVVVALLPSKRGLLNSPSISLPFFFFFGIESLCMPLCVRDFAVQVHVVPCLLDNFCYLVRLRLLFAILFL